MCIERNKEKNKKEWCIMAKGHDSRVAKNVLLARWGGGGIAPIANDINIEFYIKWKWGCEVESGGTVPNPIFFVNPNLISLKSGSNLVDCLNGTGIIFKKRDAIVFVQTKRMSCRASRRYFLIIRFLNITFPQSLNSLTK